MASNNDYLFAQVVIHNKLASPTQVKECLDTVAKAEAMGVQAKIEEVFMNKGFLSQKQVSMVLEAMGRSGKGQEISRLGIFDVTGKLGEGGMGVVYRAKDANLDREVALKILPPRLAADDNFVERFHREAKAVARLNHPNIIQVYAAGTDKGYHYMAMELVDGATTLELLEDQGKFSEKSAIKLLKEMASALKHAHRDGIVHRDIKPDNIMLTKDGESKLADLGLAKETMSASVTQSGALVGTPRYMSPEQASRAGEIDGRADFYSLGATVYHLVAGRPPFDGDNAMQVILKHLNEEMPPLKKVVPELSDDFCRLIMKMCSKKPDDRYQSAEELSDVVGKLERGERIQVQGRKTAQSQAPAAGPAAKSPGASPMGESTIIIDSESLSFKNVAPPPPKTQARTRTQARPGPSAAPPPPTTVTSADISGAFVPDESTTKPAYIVAVLLILVAAGVAGFFLFKRGKATAPPPSAPVVKQVPKRPKTSPRLLAIFRDLDSQPKSFVSNLDKLKALDPNSLSRADQGKLQDRIERVEQEARKGGENVYKKAEQAVTASLAKSKLLEAHKAIESFPPELRIPYWSEQLEKLASQVRAKASASVQSTIAQVKKKIEEGKLSEVAKLALTLPWKEIALAPEQSRKLKDLMNSAKTVLERQTTANREARNLLGQIQAKILEGNVLGAIAVADSALENKQLLDSLSGLARKKQLVYELTALRDTRDLALDFLQKHIGQEIVFRSLPTMVRSYKDGVVDLQVKKGKHYKNIRIDKLFRNKDLVALASMANNGRDDPTQELKSIILLLYSADHADTDPETRFRRLSARTPKETLAPYQAEFDYRNQLRAAKKSMVYIPIITYPFGITEKQVAAEQQFLKKEDPDEQYVKREWLFSEFPQSQTTLDAFLIDRYEVSNGDYEKFLDEIKRTKDHSKCHGEERKNKDHSPAFWEDPVFGSGQKDLPVVGIDWYDAYAYAAWKGKRLPTEAEWECAASWDAAHNKKTKFPWSDRFIASNANLAKLQGGKLVNGGGGRDGKPVRVTSNSRGASPWGCRNMCGNVWEWVSDNYAPDYKRKKVMTNPAGPLTRKDDRKIIRGGSYRSFYYLGRTSSRNARGTSARENDLGFRCVKPIPRVIEIRMKRFTD